MPDVSSWLKVWTTGRQFSTLWETKPCCCSCNMWYSIVLLKHPKPFWKKSLDGSICCSKTCICFSALMLPFWMFFSHRIVSYRTVPYRIVPYRIVSYRIVSYHQKCRILNWLLKISWMLPLLFSLAVPVSIITNKNFKFDHRTVSHFISVYSRWTLAQRRCHCFWVMFTHSIFFMW